MKTAEIKQAVRAGALELINGESILTDLDSQTGDGDHGLTMKKIAENLIRCCDEQDSASVGEFFSELAESILPINGGSILSLWVEMLFGIADETEGKEELERKDTTTVLDGALRGISSISHAAPGDKTLVDTLTAVRKTCDRCAGEPDSKRFWTYILQAAEDGAENTRKMTAKYGRAKQLLDGSAGYLDPGAVSMAMFIRGIAKHLGGKNAE